MTRKTAILATATAAIALAAPLVWSHCQVPCGIYDDQARLTAIAEHITTIDKAITQINALSAEPKVNYNQVVRWVTAKDTHADDLAHIVTYYFMAQRIKLPPDGDKDANTAYVHKLTLLHKLLVTAMTAKQTTDPATVATLRATLEQFTTAYLGPKPAEHAH